MTNSLDARLWTALLRRPDASLKKRLLELWTAAGIIALIALAWAEPFSARLLPAWMKPFVMFAQ